jgi:hypothetical protein
VNGLHRNSLPLAYKSRNTENICNAPESFLKKNVIIYNLYITVDSHMSWVASDRTKFGEEWGNSRRICSEVYTWIAVILSSRGPPFVSSMHKFSVNR